jgi:hypothetical protein
MSGPKTILLLVARSGEILSGFASPWEDLVEASSLLTELNLANVEGEDGCWVALVKGRGFTRFSEGRFEDPRAYVEDLPLPRMGRRVRTEGDRPTAVREWMIDPWYAANGITAEPDRLYVPFVGRTEYAGRVIDVYDGNGRYRESYLAPMRIKSLAVENGVFYILHSEDLYPALAALRPRKR